MPTITFSSDQLPPHLSDAERFSLWYDLHYANIAKLDYWRSDAPFQARLAFTEFGSVGIGQMNASLKRASHDRLRLASSKYDYLALMINESEGTIRVRCRSHESFVVPGAAALVSPTEAEDFETDRDHVAWKLLRIPRAMVLRAVPGAEDLVGTAVGADNAAFGMLRDYARLSLQHEATDPKLTAHIEQTLTDLVALTLGAEKEAAEIAGMRGMRAARLETILQAIAAGYRDPEFSAASVAHKLKMSERYLQSLLHDTGTGFSERVLERRLQHAAELLGRAGAANRKVSDIAFACGFRDVSYFHRCFRRRFGMSPAGVRAH